MSPNPGHRYLCLGLTQKKNADLNCDDHNPCTVDDCQEGQCVHEPVSGSQCDDGNTCTDGVCAGVYYSCDDSSLCTTDACNGNGGCTHTTINCDDGDSGTIDTCSAATGCVHTPAGGTLCVGGSSAYCNDSKEHWTGSQCCVEDVSVCTGGSPSSCNKAGMHWTGSQCCVE